jgi:amino acid permease (GABA permease)
MADDALKLGNPHSEHARDAAQLAALGHEQQLERNFSFFSMLGLAFSILNSWTALAASLSVGLPSGGPATIIWGLVVAGMGALTLAASNAEFLSSYPSSAGQYHWAAIITPKRWVPIVSWVTGWINVSGWVALSASGGVLGGQLLLGIITMYNPDFAPTQWQFFLVFLLYTIIGFVINLFSGSGLPIITKAALIWSIVGMLATAITVLVCGAPEFQPASFVFGSLINTTGWPDGVAWLLGLLQGSLALTGFDAVAHMIEEIPNPCVRGPRVMLICVLMGLGTGIMFQICLLFIIRDVDSVVHASTGPLIEIYLQASSSKAGTVCLVLFPMVCLVFGTVGIMATSTRMVYAFARDRGLPFSQTFAEVHPRWSIPVNALLLTNAVVVMFGLIYLGSTSALNAILSAAVVALSVSYAVAPAINCIRGRTMLLTNRAFALPPLLGWFCNLVSLDYKVP